jgi:hypothetical protein
MKAYITIIATFALAITALHAQVSPGTPPVLDPAASPAVQATIQDAAATAAQMAVDPAVQAAVTQALDSLGLHKYTGLVAVIGLAIFYFARVAFSLYKGKGLVESLVAALLGTNTPMRSFVILGSLCMLTLSSCSLLPLLADPAFDQAIVSLGSWGLDQAVKDGVIKKGQVVTITRDASRALKVAAVISDPNKSISDRIVSLATLNLNDEFENGDLKLGDKITIQPTAAVVNKAPVAPLPTTAN